MATTSTQRRSRAWAASSAARAGVAESDTAMERAVGNLGIGGLRETEPSLSRGSARGAKARKSFEIERISGELADEGLRRRFDVLGRGGSRGQDDGGDGGDGDERELLHGVPL